MDDAARQALVVQYLEHETTDLDVSHQMYDPDAVLEFPQSGERFEGVANFKVWREQYPANVTMEVQRLRGGGDVWVAELRIGYDGSEPQYGVSIIEFSADKVVRETI